VAVGKVKPGPYTLIGAEGSCVTSLPLPPDDSMNLQLQCEDSIQMSRNDHRRGMDCLSIITDVLSTTAELSELNQNRLTGGRKSFQDPLSLQWHAVVRTTFFSNLG
jgi:hypothetical protein